MDGRTDTPPLLLCPPMSPSVMGDNNSAINPTHRNLVLRNILVAQALWQVEYNKLVLNLSMIIWYTDI